MGLKAVVREAGRVLSGANQTKIQQASDHIASAKGHLDDVIKSVGGDTSDDPMGESQRLNEAVRSQNQVRQLIQDALRATAGSDWNYPWVADCFDDYAIVDEAGDFFSIPYAIGDDGTVTLGQPTPVMVTYTATSDATGDGDNDGDDGVLAPPGVPTSESKRIVVREADAEMTQTVGGKKFPASDFAYVPNAHKPSTWKLRLTAEPGGDPDSGIVGAAAAALGAGFRGQKVDIPAGDLAGVKAKVRAAWTKANPDKDKDEMPEGIKEAALARLTGDLVPLVETAVRSDGTAQLKIIQAGWGSTGYYPADVLKRDAQTAFPSGTHMYLDHPTLTEAAERPERSLKDLAATLMEDAHWIDGGPDGPGVYAKAQVVEGYRDLLNAVASNTGVSIHAQGSLDESGEAEGKRGPIIRRIASATESQNSVDFVTRPGAGGHMVELFEAARTAPERTAKMADDTKLTEALSEIARLKEVNVLNDAEKFLASGLKDVELPDMTKGRIAEALGKNPPAKDGRLDRETFATRLAEAIKTETEYLVEVAGYGRVSGMGYSAPVDASDPVKLAESSTAMFQRHGLSEEEAKIAAAGRR